MKQMMRGSISQAWKGLPATLRPASTRLAVPGQSRSLTARAAQNNDGSSSRSSDKSRPHSGKGRGGAQGRRPRRFGECEPGAAASRQASFALPLPSDPRVAIIGGGLSGLVCALELARAGVRSVVFDTGEHGVGGRLATRSSSDGSLTGAPPGLDLTFDHAAQYFTAADPAFRAMAAEWEADGAVARWGGPVVGTLQGGRFTPDSHDGGAPQERFVGVGGMRRLAQYLAGCASRERGGGRGGGGGRGPAADALVEVRRPQWVSDARHTADGWQLFGRGRDQGLFDAVVIAHNGKCANRLAAPMGAPAVYGQLRRLKLSANWVLLAAFASPVAAPGGMQGAAIRGSPVLSWAANNTKKLGLQGGDSGVECWTLISTQEYGRANKVPQENVPPEVAQRVTREMLAAFEQALGLPAGGLPPLAFSRTQLWGAALPQSSPRCPCIWDPVGRVGVCGDWVLEGGSMQAAALSGQALAAQILATRGVRPAELAGLAVGLAAPFAAVGGEEFGQFPSAAAADAAAAEGGKEEQVVQPAQQQPARQPKEPRQSRPQQRMRPTQQRPQLAAPPTRPAGRLGEGAEGAAPQLLERPVRRT